MNVTLYAYNLFEKRIREKGKKDVEYFEKDFVECVKALMIRKPNDRKYELGNKKKIIYINDFEYMQNQHMLFLVFKSAEYGKIRKVVDTDTLEERKTKKKGKKDGDEETTCILIKFDADAKSKSAVCLIQANSNGVSLTRIFEYINIEIVAIHNAHNDNIKYKVSHTNIVSRDFLKALEKAQKIRAVKLVIDSDATGDSEFKDYACENVDISNEFDIVYKPSTKGGIGKNTVKKFFKDYEKEGANIKKIRVDINEADGNPLSFDTEKMKEKEYVVVTDTLTQEPRIDELKVQMLDKIRNY